MTNTEISLTGCTASIFDAEDNLLVTTTIMGHNTKGSLIVIDKPLDIKQDELYRIRILLTPTPCEYMGKLTVYNDDPLAFSLGGRLKRGRNIRYKIKKTATIKNLIYGDFAFPLNAPIEVNIVDISKSDIKIRTDFNTLFLGDKYSICIKIGDKYEQLFAEVVDVFDVENMFSEYGCSFYAKGTGLEKRLL